MSWHIHAVHVEVATGRDVQVDGVRQATAELWDEGVDERAGGLIELVTRLPLPP